MEEVPDFRVEVIKEEDASRVVPIGELDLSTAPILEERLREAEAHEHVQVLLDLSKLEFIDSSGLGVIFASHTRQEERNGRLLMVSGSPHVQRVFELAGLTSELHFV